MAGITGAAGHGHAQGGAAARAAGTAGGAKAASTQTKKAQGTERSVAAQGVAALGCGMPGCPMGQAGTDQATGGAKATAGAARTAAAGHAHGGTPASASGAAPAAQGGKGAAASVTQGAAASVTQGGTSHAAGGAGHNMSDMQSAPDLSRFSAAQQAEAVAFKHATASAVQRMGASTIEGAKAAGYSVVQANSGNIHMENTAAKSDGKSLDPNAPERIIFDPKTGRAFGVMFTGGGNATVAGGIGGFHSHAGGGMNQASNGGMFHMFFTPGNELAAAFTQAGFVAKRLIP